MLAAADTYVVVIALTAIMADLGISITNLDRATPIISGFLVGYVAMLPLLGRLSDVRGREVVYLWCLLAFAVGSLLTATAPQLPQLVIGRTLQGAGGGGLVPVTLAMVADHWPAERRNLPLGVVAGVQELGSMLGPLYGAAILAVASWRLIFWINLPLAALLAVGLVLTRRRVAATGGRRRDPVSWVLLLLLLAALLLVITSPAALADNNTLGVLYGPVVGSSQATTPLALFVYLCAVLLLARQALGPPSVPRLISRSTAASLAGSDWRGALLLLAALALIVMCFAGANPTTELLAGSWPVMLPLAGVCLVGFVWQERRHPDPFINLSAVAHRASVGAMLTNLFIGAALMTALVDVPLFARAVSYQDATASQAQLDSALLLVRLLVAIPVGALLGGAVCTRLGHRATVAGAMLLCAAGFVLMAHWQATTTAAALWGIGWLHPSDAALVLSGLGFGLAIAPVNAAMLASVGASSHGVAAALVVMARTVGMLAGLSLLTAIGLSHFYSSVNGLCPNVLSCPTSVIIGAVTNEIHTIFVGAAVCAVVAAAIGAVCLSGHSRGGIGEVLGAG